MNTPILTPAQRRVMGQFRLRQGWYVAPPRSDWPTIHALVRKGMLAQHPTAGYTFVALTQAGYDWLEARRSDDR
jgi:hypothetical protein